MILLIHSYGGANETVKRHWPFYEKAGADRIVGVDTEKRDCWFPDGIEKIVAGDGRYMVGPNLVKRLLETVAWCSNQEDDQFVIAEYDTLFFKPLPGFTGICAHRSGEKVFDSKSSFFSHNPWCFDKENCKHLIYEMIRIIDEGHCSYGRCESSPDVFFAWACERAGIKVRHDLFTMFTQNSMDLPGALDQARDAYRAGVDVIHGIKTKTELEYLLS